MFKKVNIYVKSVIMLEFGYFLNKLRTLLSEVQVKMSIEWKAIKNKFRDIEWKLGGNLARPIKMTVPRTFYEKKFKINAEYLCNT